MKLVWVHSQPGECEYDVKQSCLQSGIELRTIWVPPVQPSQIASVLKSEAYDLCILRYPQENWSVPTNEKNVICWTSEQGPTRSHAIASSRRFPNVAINNKYEERFYPGKKLFYLPFGCYNTEEATQQPIYDVVVSSNPHYACKCEGDLKKISIDTMIIPLLGKFNVKIYGMWPSQHGWSGVPGVSEVGHFDGVSGISHVPFVQQGKLYVDCTWNWRDGGYGCKLARALATGVPVIWHKTLGMELDGFEKGNQLDWSSSPQETITLVDYYLTHDKERIEMGRRGKEWFSNNWEWSLNFNKIYGSL